MAAENIPLSPCPFCGKQADFIEMWFGDEQKPLYNVGCEDHVIDICEASKQRAALEWNRRPDIKE